MMKKIKFNSLELNKNNMVKYILFIVLFPCSFLMQAQSVSLEKKDTHESKKAANISLNQKFSAKVLNAYQENSKTKIEDLFSCFQMLTDASLPDDLKKEVVKNINLAYKNPNEMVVDFTSNSFEKIPLQQLIERLLISEPILFSVSKDADYNSVDFQSWQTAYSVVRTKSGIQTKINITQKVYFYEMPKTFGSTYKVVLTTFLGAM